MGQRSRAKRAGPPFGSLSSCMYSPAYKGAIEHLSLLWVPSTSMRRVLLGSLIATVLMGPPLGPVSSLMTHVPLPILGVLLCVFIMAALLLLSFWPSKRKRQPTRTCHYFRDRIGEWRWTVRHDNGHILADSGEGYSNKADCVGESKVILNFTGCRTAFSNPRAI